MLSDAAIITALVGGILFMISATTAACGSLINIENTPDRILILDVLTLLFIILSIIFALIGW